MVYYGDFFTMHIGCCRLQPAAPAWNSLEYHLGNMHCPPFVRFCRRATENSAGG
jgi:hypothetical protein